MPRRSWEVQLLKMMLVNKAEQVRQKKGRTTSKRLIGKDEGQRRKRSKAESREYNWI